MRFEDGPAIKAIELMRRGLHSGFYAPGFNAMKEEEARNAFQSGKAVFLRNWPYVYPLICEHDNCPFGVAPLPGVPALGGHNLAVSAFSHNQPAAKEFARFVSTTFDVQRDIASKFSLAPTMGSVYDTLRDKPVMLQLSRSLREARPRPATPDWAEISTKMQEEIFRAYNGEETPQQAVDAIRAFLKTKTAKS